VRLIALLAEVSWPVRSSGAGAVMELTEAQGVGTAKVSQEVRFPRR
jgi:hypothetical protein